MLPVILLAVFLLAPLAFPLTEAPLGANQEATGQIGTDASKQTKVEEVKTNDTTPGALQGQTGKINENAAIQTKRTASTTTQEGYPTTVSGQLPKPVESRLNTQTPTSAASKQSGSLQTRTAPGEIARMSSNPAPTGQGEIKKTTGKQTPATTQLAEGQKKTGTIAPPANNQNNLIILGVLLVAFVLALAYAFHSKKAQGEAAGDDKLMQKRIESKGKRLS